MGGVGQGAHHQSRLLNSSARPAPADGVAMTSSVPFTSAVSLRAVGKTFGDVAALRNLDLVAPEGRITVLLGPNGAGNLIYAARLHGVVPSLIDSRIAEAAGRFGISRTLDPESSQAVLARRVGRHRHVLGDIVGCRSRVGDGSSQRPADRRRGEGRDRRPVGHPRRRRDARPVGSEDLPGFAPRAQP